VLGLIIRWLKKKKETIEPELQPYYLKGFYFKLLAIPLFLFHHTFIYTGGVDQFTYFWSSDEIIQLLWIKPSLALDILFRHYSTLNQENLNFEMSHFIFAQNESFCIKLTSVISLLTGNTFLVTSVILSLFAYLGCWKIFSLINRFYPGNARLFAFSTVYIPSIVFWTCVISKEVYCFGAMGFLLYDLFDWVYFKRRSGLQLIRMAICVYLLYRIKLYILIALIIAFLFFFLFQQLEKIRNSFLRIMILPLSLFILGSLVFNTWSSLGDEVSQFALKNILQTIKINYDYLTQENFASSRYTLGEVQANLGSISSLLPASINVTLFRPYLWEANKPITLLAAMESLLTLLVTLYVLLRVRWRAIYYIFSEKFLLFSVVFALSFSAAVGLTSGNFGTLMRYKIPMMPFYFSGLAILYVLWKKKQKSRDTNESLV